MNVIERIKNVFMSDVNHFLEIPYVLKREFPQLETNNRIHFSTIASLFVLQYCQTLLLKESQDQWWYNEGRALKFLREIPLMMASLRPKGELLIKGFWKYNSDYFATFKSGIVTGRNFDDSDIPAFWNVMEKTMYPFAECFALNFVGKNMEDGNIAHFIWYFVKEANERYSSYEPWFKCYFQYADDTRSIL